MCFSATVSYSAAAVLVSTGLYAVHQAKELKNPYWLWALIPVFFGIQQAFEGGVWQALEACNAEAALPYTLGFQLFSHFLWLWWIPLCSYLAETTKLRKWLFGGCTLLGAFSGTLVYSTMLLHPEWISLAVKNHSIIYDFSVPYSSSLHLPITPLMLYGLINLV